MKLCILSMQRVPNTGSVLQSYSLKKILTENGHSVKFIDIESREDDNILMANNRKDFSVECDNRTGILSKLKKVDKYFFNRIRIRRLNSKQDDIFKEFLINELGIAGNQDIFDCCIIGSDEVFNCSANTAWGFTTQLFGDVKQAKKVITYAASCGATAISDIPQSVKKKIKQAFEKISAFSVRDKNTFDFVRGLSNTPVRFNLDPVIVGDFEQEISQTSIETKLPKRYCIVYSYYNRINNTDEISTIIDFCRTNKMEIISLGAPQGWISKHIVLNPFEILAAFKNAEFVITDTFHGTIFAAKYSKHFMTMIRDSNRNKMKSLIEQLEIGEHYAASIADINRIYKIEKDQEKIDQIAYNARKETIEYLNAAL